MTPQPDRSGLDSFRLFDTLTDAERERLGRRAVRMNRSKGAILFLSATDSPVLYLIHKGQVKLSRYAPDGRELILDVRRAGDVIGELALLGWSRREEEAELISNALISTLPIGELLSLLATNARFSVQVAQLIGGQLKRMQSRYESLCFQGAGSRVRQFIREQADTIGRRVGTEIAVDMTLTHQDIARLTSTSRQLVTSELSALKRRKIITYSRSRLFVCDYQALLP